MRTRSREYVSSSYSVGTQVATFIGSQTTTDELHIWPPEKTWGLGNNGGLLQLSRLDADGGGVRVFPRYWNGVKFLYGWDGFLFAKRAGIGSIATTYWPLWTRTAPVGEAEMLTLGATAISRCAPTNPHASLSQTLGELRRDGIPAVPALQAFQKGVRPIAKRSKRGKKSVGKTVPTPGSMAGSEYLNVVFGWKPLLNDIRKIATAQRDSKRVLEQYVKDAGRQVRRRYEFPTETSTTVTALGNSTPTPTLNSYLYGVSSGPLTKTVVVNRRKWFSGAFTYHVSDADSLVGSTHRSLQMANHLTGVGVTPAVMWDLMPYSWAVDWFGNIGDVINNASMMASDGLVVVYGYIMAETVTTTTYTLSGITVRNYNGIGFTPPLILQQVFTEVVKQRRSANPFGFGLTGLPSTASQWGVIAALGLSRDGRKIAL